MLRSLLDLNYEPSAIVTMADDGGSSGRLRRELGIVPPGDVRNCLAALAAPEHELLARLLGYRFVEGEGITGHAVGNLMLAALTDMDGSFEAAVKYLEEHLSVRGRVLPSTFDDVVLAGFDREGNRITGQESLAKNPIAIVDVELHLAHAAALHDLPRANPEAVTALQKADLIIICPGSLYTSIIPNFLVPEICQALCMSDAPVIYFCNVANMRGETSGYTPLDYIDALNTHGLRGCLDAVVLPEDATGAAEAEATQALGAVSTPAPLNDAAPQDAPASVTPAAPTSAGPTPLIRATPEVVSALQACGLEVFIEPLASATNPFRHDQAALTGALEKVIRRVLYR